MPKSPLSFFDEMQLKAANASETNARAISVRDIYAAYHHWLKDVPHHQLDSKRQEAELLFRRVGITFNVYGETDGAERLIPFDVIPRLLSAKEWSHLSAGAIQRVRALNMFLHDIYHDQEIIKAGIIPSSILANSQYRPEMFGVDVPNQIYAHIAGIDLVRTSESQFYVLEDNLRTPSGVSYMLEDRKMMMRLFPELFRRYSIAPVDHYPQVLLKNLRAVAQPGVTDPTVVLLSPGAYNSAYFEHAFIAQQMGIELVEGQDLFVRNNAVFMRTTQGPQRVDVIYRRIDDDYIDPLVFNQNSMLGVPGLLSVYRNGGVTLANAVGTGVADDKATYIHVPAMIKFYLGEQPILENVPTYELSKEEDLQYVLAHLHELVVKEVQGSGGYGMLVGPAASKKEIEEFRIRIVSSPASYIAQPTLALSTCPTLVEKGIAPRHVDLRPFVLSGKTVSLVPGALCRVALKEGSLVVNSSQGGGTKDTWVLENDGEHESVAGAIKTQITDNKTASRMLSRTADHLYWMARYIERAENMARVLDVTYNMSLVPNAAVSESALWLPALEISGNVDAYDEEYGEYTAAGVIHYLAMDTNNPSSIYNALRNARENARAVRVAMTSETWENINALWLEFQQFIGQDLAKNGLREFCDWVKARSHLFRGVCFGTMLRDDAFSFVRLGTFIERADNTARLLDVKYHLLLPSEEEVGGAVDYYEWSAVLRSVSAFQAYQKIFSDTIEPWRVAELLVLRRDMPRSLHACFDEITPILEQLSGSRHTECRRLAGELHARLRYGKMQHIFQKGLHEFLTDFIDLNNKLGAEVHKTFLSITAA